MTTPSTCTCAACGLVLPIAEFSRYYTLTEAVRRGYGKPFDDRHAHIAADDRTVYSRIPQRVQYYGKYCRSCKPQKPFIDMRTEANIYLAASLGAFGPEKKYADAYAGQLVSARRKAVMDHRSANTPGRFLRQTVVREHLIPALHWQYDLATRRRTDIELDACLPPEQRKLSTRDLPQYQAFAQANIEFWYDLRALCSMPKFKLPRRLLMLVTDPNYADVRVDVQDELDELRDQKNGHRLYVLALLFQSLIANESPFLPRFEELRKKWHEYLSAAVRNVNKAPLALGLYDFVQQVREENLEVRDPGPYVHDPDDPKGLVDWMYAKSRYEAYLKSRGTKRKRGRPRKDEE